MKHITQETETKRATARDCVRRFVLFLLKPFLEISAICLTIWLQSTVIFLPRGWWDPFYMGLMLVIGFHFWKKAEAFELKKPRVLTVEDFKENPELLKAAETLLKYHKVS